ncbi:high affinity immunoglobulin epsilon receptor subunit beta [Trichechus manatus latirostris]|uniref:high affinity immunoglobulin epsilon receptor subunit beta n=1 Tax=Trichechus manatus latirostris TaxID=127582 RepID=UPI000CA06F75|nr:high affinity immunoglobulin epsilon receptor subunit beta [Trichechus manatus latirostris]
MVFTSACPVMRADFAQGVREFSNDQISVKLQSVSEIELSEVALQDKPIPEKAAPCPPQYTWPTFLKKELEFLGVTQILIGLICLSFGTVVYSVLDISGLEGKLFSSFKAGYPFWGAISFAISGFLSIICERKNWSSLKKNLFCCCKNIDNIEFSKCLLLLLLLVVQQEIVAMLLCLTILGFCSAVSLTIYGVRELLEGDKVPEDRLYEELNIYSPIYSELEDREEMPPPTDS